ncbi:MAG: alkene reductase [Rhodospirillales bacterium]|nr:alkene reductase [Rhodospirillales bacterium]
MPAIAAQTKTPTLFDPVQVGRYLLRNRIVMAPLTRSRSRQPGDIPGVLNATYYCQRATAGLIIAEATQITPQGKGYAYTPGIHSPEQIEGWQLVTEAVHAQGGHIFLQLWHVGRISHESLQPDGALPVAPSAIMPNGLAFTEHGFLPHPTPRALETDEIPGIVEDYAQATRNALTAGFDGVEIHGANGYLLDQFLHDGSNKRTDRYGGPIENRARFLVEVMEAVSRVAEPGRVGVRVSPTAPGNDMSDSNAAALYLYVVEQMNRLDLAYLHVIEGATQGPREVPGGFDLQILRRAFKNKYIANNGYDPKLAAEVIASGRADLVAFGRPYIANPDLVDRIRCGAPLVELDRSTLYGGDAHGYIDYPALREGG